MFRRFVALQLFPIKYMLSLATCHMATLIKVVINLQAEQSSPLATDIPVCCCWSSNFAVINCAYLCLCLCMTDASVCMTDTITIINYINKHAVLIIFFYFIAKTLACCCHCRQCDSMRWMKYYIIINIKESDCMNIYYILVIELDIVVPLTYKSATY